MRHRVDWAERQRTQRASSVAHLLRHRVLVASEHLRLAVAPRGGRDDFEVVLVHNVG